MGEGENKVFSNRHIPVPLCAPKTHDGLALGIISYMFFAHHIY